MIPASSSIPTPAAWPQDNLPSSSLAPSPSTSDDFTPLRTLLSDVDIVPFTTPCPTSTPNIVQIVLHTTLTIPDYSRFYHTPIESFRPSYLSLPDGSLITAPLIDSIRISAAWLVVGGVLSTFFIRNTIVSVYYCRTAKVKNKALFYLLLLSQFLGVVVGVVLLVADFDQAVNCTISGIVKRACTILSGTLLITGILGVKAYRCLSNARIVIIVLAILRTAILALSGFGLSHYRGARRLSGSCMTISGSSILAITVILQFVESFFICACFVSHPVDEARLSLQVSVENRESFVENRIKEDHHESGYSRRGWWDYVPDAHAKSTVDAGQTGLIDTIRDALRRFWLGEPVPPSVAFQRKSSLPGNIRYLSLLVYPQRPELTQFHSVSQLLNRKRSPEHAIQARLHRHASRRVFLVIGIVMLVGVSRKILMGPNAWVMVDWVVISSFTMHSFARVVRRHEREAILAHPTAWDPIYRAELEAAKAFRNKHARRAWSPVSVASHWRPRRRDGTQGDPLGSTRSRGDRSVNIPGIPPYAGPSRVRSTSVRRTREFSISTSTSLAPSPSPTMDSVFQQSQWDGPVVLPSPDVADYASTDASTPVSDSHAIVSGPSTAPAHLQSRRSSSPPSFYSRTYSRWDRSSDGGFQ
ncbi:hypothetical protein A0H81_00652 [Grifola frondosa]|uniref:G-protein coupled receptors family 3 profile domain-containing protein n=1 Tax=Grifola frondosa TaxID=5627 RepID=A0A1C7MSK4_GRIFR|nr:hypothetical protein A0H81_00652 [Grifola frondosa]